MADEHVIACHCGTVRIRVRAPLTDLVECNCSTCAKSGFLHWKVPARTTTLAREKIRLSTYVWRDVDCGHHFCPTCGTPILRTGYANGIVSLNARALVGVDVFSLSALRYDGRHDMPPGPQDI